MAYTGLTWMKILEWKDCRQEIYRKSDIIQKMVTKKESAPFLNCQIIVGACGRSPLPPTTGNFLTSSLMLLDYFKLGDIVKLIPEKTKSS